MWPRSLSRFSVRALSGLLERGFAASVRTVRQHVARPGRSSRACPVPAVVKPDGRSCWVVVWLRGPAAVEGAAQVADPGVGVLPGDEVAAVVVGVDVDVVEPVGLRAGL